MAVSRYKSLKTAWRDWGIVHIEPGMNKAASLYNAVLLLYHTTPPRCWVPPTGDATAGDATAGDATGGDATAGDATGGDATTDDATAGDASDITVSTNYSVPMPMPLLLMLMSMPALTKMSSDAFTT